MDYIFVILISYLCGSVPFGLIITKVFIKQDVREIGSGNIGATNVLRTGKKYLAICTLLLDMLKGFLPVYYCINYFPELFQISALVAFLGHIFLVWLKFKGGKGVATYLGILFALSLSLSILFIFTWVVLSLIFKYSSVSSMFSAFSVMVINFITDNIILSINPNFVPTNEIKMILFIFFILIIFTHKKNISNLKNKTEKKIKI